MQQVNNTALPAWHTGYYLNHWMGYYLLAGKPFEVRNQPLMSTQPSIPFGVGKLSTRVNVEYVHLCWVAGNTMW